MKPRVLVTKHIYPSAVEYLREHADTDYHDSDEGYDAAQLLEHLAGKQAVVSQLTDKFSADVLSALPELKVISNVAVGFDNIDIAAATQRRIIVTNTPEVLTDTTADFAFTLLMATARRLVEADKYLRAGKWTQWRIDLFTGHDIHHATLGILGMGRIGQTLARRARGFEMRVIYNDVQRAAPEMEQELQLEYVPFDSVLDQSDFISVHVPLLPATRHLLGAAQFARMKKNAILINTSRGPVVDEAALADALAAGEIAGAGLDVFEREPQVEPRLLDMENVVLAPHIASASVDTRTKMCMMAAQNCVAALAGDRPPNLVNTALFD
ncbi:MAG TPA: D-glycerate dehydrogenase [Bryobacterales bacterium]|nr:D-glycerate dehydrogenase [Bryobacterales bacterium]